MIYGIGTDIVSTNRIRTALDRHGDRFAERVLAPAEREAWRVAEQPVRLIAKRWAVKEAFGKAARIGVRAPITLQSVWLTHGLQGEPILAWDDEVSIWLTERKIVRAHVSLSDEADYAVAYVILEGEGA